MMKKILLLMFVLLLGASFGQKRAFNWQFGDGGGIKFDGSGNITSFTSSLEGASDAGGIAYGGFEGVSSISDASGNVLFYSEGTSILDASDKAMPNANFKNGEQANSIGGSRTASQSVIIVPNPVNKDLYYVFTQSGNQNKGKNNQSGLKYSVVDMSLPGNGSVNSPLGDVTSVKSIQLVGDCQENLAVVPDKSGGYWVITHIIGSGFKSFHIDGTTGNINTIAKTSGTSGTATVAGISSIKFSPC